MSKGITRSEARAALGGISEAAFTRLLQAGLPRKGDGKSARYDAQRIVRWHADWKFEQGRQSVQPKDYEDAKARKMIAEAELAELDVAIRRGELMTVEEGRKVIAQFQDRTVSALKAFPTRHAHTLVGIQTLPEAEARARLVASEIISGLADTSDMEAPEGADAEAERETSA